METIEIPPAGRAGIGRDAAGLIGSLAVCGLVAVIGGAVTVRSVNTWYRTLRKPRFNPPDQVFGPVWSLLYLLIAVAAWRVWRSDDPAVRRALAAHAIQLGLNLNWSIQFFGRHRIGAALADIVGLCLAIAATIVLFWRIDRLSGALLVPYLLWVAFALLLNAEICRLNSGSRLGPDQA